MKERSIIFSNVMVRAIQDGRKTQTRRVVKPQPVARDETGPYIQIPLTYPDLPGVTFMDRKHISCPYGQPGDRLWVRETWYNDVPDEQDRRYIEYRADHDCRHWEGECPCRDADGRSAWRPSIHMPRWASRITLENGLRLEVIKAPARTADDYNADWAKRPSRWCSRIILPEDMLWHWDWDFVMC